MKLRTLGFFAALSTIGCPVHELRITVIDAASDTPRDAVIDRNDATMDVVDATIDRNDATMDVVDATIDRNDATMDVVDATIDRADATMDAVDVTIDRSDATMDAVDVPRDLVDASTDVAIDRTDETIDVPAPTEQTSCGSSAPAIPGCGQAYVPGGTFALGDSAAEMAAPMLTAVTVNGFYIDRYEVTVARFRRFWSARDASAIRATPIAYVDGAMSWGSAATEPRPTSSYGCNWTSALGVREDQPVNCLTWWTAQEFCVWDGGRLPTEAEWELAARGTEARPFPWGIDEPDDTRVCASLMMEREIDAGADVPPLWTCPETVSTWSRGETASGIAHLSGNLAEYTADVWSSYSDSCWGMAPRINPRCATRPDGGTPYRAVRGGAINAVRVSALRSASRAFAQENFTFTREYGFRCARSR